MQLYKIGPRPNSVLHFVMIRQMIKRSLINSILSLTETVLLVGFVDGKEVMGGLGGGGGGGG